MQGGNERVGGKEAVKILADRRQSAVTNSQQSWHEASTHHLPPVLTMTSQPPKGRDVALPTLEVFIQILDIVKDASGIPPAQIALASASALLTTIRVCFPPPREDKLLAHFYLGHDGQL
jgi:hypothetical protein